MCETRDDRTSNCIITCADSVLLAEARPSCSGSERRGICDRVVWVNCRCSAWKCSAKKEARKFENCLPCVCATMFNQLSLGRLIVHKRILERIAVNDTRQASDSVVIAYRGRVNSTRCTEVELETAVTDCTTQNVPLERDHVFWAIEI